MKIRLWTGEVGISTWPLLSTSGSVVDALPLDSVPMGEASWPVHVGEDPEPREPLCSVPFDPKTANARAIGGISTTACVWAVPAAHAAAAMTSPGSAWVSSPAANAIPQFLTSCRGPLPQTRTTSVPDSTMASNVVTWKLGMSTFDSN